MNKKKWLLCLYRPVITVWKKQLSFLGIQLPGKGQINKQLVSCFLILLFLGLIQACDLINPEEEIPAYIYIEDFELNTSPNEGSNSEKISEVWAFLDNEFLGAFPIPARIPVLKSGNVSVRLEAGIKENGVSATPDIYPFYSTFTRDLQLEPNKEDTLRPKIGYKSNTEFAFIESFEASNSIFSTVVTGTQSSELKITQEDAFEGFQSGLISLSVDDPFVEIATSPRYSGLIDNGNVVFLELNYKSDVPVSFGIIGFNRGNIDPVALSFQAGFNPSDTWNKIYFNITPVVFESRAEEFQIILRAALPLNEQGTFAQDTGTVRLDNIKLLHF